jgi:hypothetical protein
MVKASRRHHRLGAYGFGARGVTALVPAGRAARAAAGFAKATRIADAEGVTTADAWRPSVDVATIRNGRARSGSGTSIVAAGTAGSTPIECPSAATLRMDAFPST